MAATPPDIEQVLEQLRGILMRWQSDGTLGEVVVVVGGNQYQPEERPTRRHTPVKRESGKAIVRVP